MATIDEIARRANVSKTTVSFVINGKPGVSEATANLVRAVMAELDYVPSVLAQRFASRRSLAVALIAQSYPSVFHDPRHAEIVDAVYSTLEDRDYSLVLGTSNKRFLEERRHIKILRSGQVDGLLLLEPTLDQDYLADLAEQNAPVVIINGEGCHLGLAAVRTNDTVVGRIAAEHLLSLGHRRIGFIDGGRSHQSAIDRALEFQRLLALAACPLDPRRIFHGEINTSEITGRDGCRAILEHMPDTTAIFCCNDTMALNALDAAREMNVDVPGRLSLLGVDDHPTSIACRPQLSSIRQPSYDIAKEATEMLLARLQAPRNGDHQPVTRLLPPALVPRDSTAPPAR
ncbi:MAG: LacI family DNA-binding transcriptional regulator [Phycisphaerae bacterium]|nr:LacI family DNA-binding transcriptional regulator [Phycisphaerae bacterium]